MAFSPTGDFYDPCKPPICDGEIFVRIFSYSCTSQISIVWEIDNLSSSASVTQNKVIWTMHGDRTGTIDGVASGDQYSVSFAPPDSSGIINMKIRICVNGEFYESELITFSLDDCNSA